MCPISFLTCWSKRSSRTGMDAECTAQVQVQATPQESGRDHTAGGPGPGLEHEFLTALRSPSFSERGCDPSGFSLQRAALSVVRPKA